MGVPSDTGAAPPRESAWLDLYAALRGARETDRAPLALSLMGRAPDRTGLGEANRAFWDQARALRGPGAPPAEGRLQCGACEAWLEIPLGGDFALPAPAADGAREGIGAATVEHAGRDYDIRLPTLLDPRAGASWMGALCADAPWGEAEFRAKAARALEDADPALEVMFEIACAECGASTSARLDPFAFFWSALRARARTLVDEIARLASAFGWTEDECLALGPVRRGLYLERIA